MTCKFLTLDEYAALPEDDGCRDELSRGLLVREPRPAYRHTVVVHRIQRLLMAEEALGRGCAYTDIGFLLSRDPPTVRGPDVAFVLAPHLPAELPGTWLEQAPDLAVEVLSRSNRRAGIAAKVRDYLDAGTPLIWVVDPSRRTVEVWRGPGSHELLVETDELSGEPVLPEFRVSVAELLGP